MTLVETLVVLAVVGVLVGTLMYGMQEGRTRAERTTLLADVAQLAQAQESYFGASGSYAPTLEAINFTPTAATTVLGMVALPHTVMAVAERPKAKVLCGVVLSRQPLSGGAQRIQCAEPTSATPIAAVTGAFVEFDASNLLASLVATGPSFGPASLWAAVPTAGDVLFVVWSFGDGQGRVWQGADGLQVSHAYQGPATDREARVGIWLKDGRFVQSMYPLDESQMGPGVATGTPSAGFVVSPMGAIPAGTEVTLNGAGSKDPNGQIVSYAWTVGGTTLTGMTPRIRLETPGEVTVQLVVTDNQGLTATATQKITVLASGQPGAGTPTAQWAGTPLPAIAGRPVILDAGISTDPTGNLTQYRWVFTGKLPQLAGGDGALVSDTLPDGSSGRAFEGRRLRIVWPVAGTSSVSLTVVSSTGTSNTSNASIPISPPTASPLVTITPGAAVLREGQEFSFDAAVVSGVANKVSWDMGDGTVLTGSAVSHRYMVAGSYVVRATVQSSETVAVGIANVTVLPNKAPIGNFAILPDPPVVGDPIQFDATLSTDPDGAIVMYRWLWSDGVYQTGPVVERTFGTAGSYTVALTVQDNNGAQHTLTAPVTLATSDIIAAFDVTPTSGPAGTIFNATSTTVHPEGLPLNYRWLLDGIVVGANAPSALVQPLTKGLHTVSMIAWDGVGRVDTSGAVVITMGGLPPSVSIVGAPATRSVLDTTNLSLLIGGTDGDPILNTGWERQLPSSVWVPIPAGDDVTGTLSTRLVLDDLSFWGGTIGDTLKLRAWAEDEDGTAWSAVTSIITANAKPECGDIESPDLVGGFLPRVADVRFSVDCLDPEGSPLTYEWLAPAVGAADNTATADLSGFVGATLEIRVFVRDGLDSIEVAKGFNVAAMPVPQCSHTTTSTFVLPGEPVVWTSSPECFSIPSATSAQRFLGPWSLGLPQPAPLTPIQIGLASALTFAAPAQAGRAYLYGSYRGATDTLVTGVGESGSVCTLGPPSDGGVSLSGSNGYYFGSKLFVTLEGWWAPAPCGEQQELLHSSSPMTRGPSGTDAGESYISTGDGPFTWTNDAFVNMRKSNGVFAEVTILPATPSYAIGVRTIGAGRKSAVRVIGITEEWFAFESDEPVFSNDADLFLDLAGSNFDGGSIGENVPIFAWAPSATNISREWFNVTGGGDIIPLGTSNPLNWNCFAGGFHTIKAVVTHDPLPSTGLTTQSRTIVVNCS
ncbi:MAG: PKD domain-containing protein [Gemmatimonadales bacterium]|nr:PKD domain-containing protein [Gemmatimonadales bacterium]